MNKPCPSPDTTPADWYVDADDDADYDDADRCPVCGGDGMDDDVTPCPHCDGEGYEWWA